MKKFLVIFAIASLLAGCRREDWRETTIETPSLAESQVRDAAVALARYEGVDAQSVKLDTVNKRITLRYDSMKVAQTNLRMALQDKGIEVIFPANETGVAGYINTRE